MIEWQSWLLLAALAAAIGVYGTLVGAGGGFILAPVLAIFWGVEPFVAASTSLTIVWVNSIVATHDHWRKNRIDKRTAIAIGTAGIPTSILGVFLVRHASSEIFYLLFGILLIAISSYIIWRPHPARVAETHDLGEAQDFPSFRSVPLKGTVSLGIGVGILSGFFGMGGGILITPLLLYVFQFRIREAGATSLAALIILSGFGALFHLLAGHFDFSFLVPTIIGGAVGARYGTAIAQKTEDPLIIRALAIGIIALGALMLTQFFASSTFW